MRAGIRYFSKRTVIFLGVAILLLLLTFIFPELYKIYYSPEVITRRVQKEITRSERDLNKLLNQGIKASSARSDLSLREFVEKQKSLFLTKQITLLIYNKDSLIFWTDNIFPASTHLPASTCNNCIEESRNGYYLKLIRQAGEYTFAAHQLIKNKYKYTNDYITSDFSDRFKDRGNTDFLLKESNYPIYNSAHQKLFFLGFTTIPVPGETIILLVFILFITGILYLNAALFQVYVNLLGAKKSRWFILIGFTLDTVILRIIIQMLRMPSVLYESDYFNPIFYADSEILPSLGDFLITALLALQLSYFYLKHFPPLSINRSSQSAVRRIGSFLLNLVPVLLLILLSDLIRSLIINSNITLSFNNILEFTHFSLVASCILGCLILAYLFIFQTISRITRQLYNSKEVYLFDSVIISVLFLCYVILLDTHISALLVPLSLIALYFISYKEWDKAEPEKIRLKNLPLLLLILAVFGAHQLHKYLYDKELAKRQVLAGSLIDNHDQLAEFFFKNIQTEIQENLNVRKKVDELSETTDKHSAFASSLAQKYFTGYWSKFNIQATLCSEKEQLRIKPGNYIVGCDEYFEKIIEKYGKLTTTQDLYYINTGIDQTYYLGKIQLSGLNPRLQKKVMLYVEISTPAAVKDIGYPELLLDKSQIKQNNLSEYSYAIYRSGELIKNVGEYNYFTNLNQYLTISKNSNFNASGYNHLVTKVDPKTIVVISKKRDGFMGYIAPLAFFFLFFYLIFFFISVFSGDAPLLNYRSISFTSRLQTGIVSVLLFSMLLVGGLSIYYLNRLNKSKNEQIVKEKAYSVLLELEQKLTTVDQLTPSFSEQLSDELIRLSQIYFSDINIFTPEGRLLASSRKKIFEEGLQSEYISPEALFQLNNQRKSFYIHDESIARYSYLSAYVPLRNDDNRLLGYVNLPYFARQNELKAEISTLVSAFSNIYILLTAIAIFISILISRYITHPLQLIKEKLSQVQLGKKNMKIDWSGRDEISGLIEEYNKMVDELANRAEQLAQSERESAWRQMARQVAHEIKNPLTPMKLSMQLLMRAWEDKATDWEDRLKRFSQTIIMQIDTLTAIASEFSDFAQMPATKLEKIDVVELLNISSALFKDYGYLSIHSNASEKQFYVYADEKQMLRVFNNLIKNGVQAIPPGEKGEINVKFEAKGSNCLIIFSDNGIGIPKEKQIRIFTPDFTTKSGGMGLGLAMVKSIIDNTGGSISFESDEGRGTTFYITIPMYVEENPTDNP